MLKEGENKGLTSEYSWFKTHEEDYLNEQELGYQLKDKKNRDWLYWLIAFIVTLSFVGFTVNRMSNSAGEVKVSQEISRMTAQEAVDHLFDEDGQWIRRNLTEDEFNQVSDKVDELEESSEKVHIKVRLDSAEEQLVSQLEALKLVNGLKTASGSVNIDLDREVTEKEASKFPDKYNPEYVEELRLEYEELLVLIRESYEIQDKIVGIGKKTDQYIDGNELSVLEEKVEGLPTSGRKERLQRDIKVLQELYEGQQKEIKERQAIEAERRKEEEARQQRIEAEKEAQRQKELEEERKRQEIIEEQKREQEERDRIEQERREEVIREQERLEEEQRIREEEAEKERQKIIEEQNREEQESNEQNSQGNVGDGEGE